MLAHWLDGLFFFDFPLLLLIGVTQHVKPVALGTTILVVMLARAFIAREQLILTVSVSQRRFCYVVLIETARVIVLVFTLYTLKDNHYL